MAKKQAAATEPAPEMVLPERYDPSALYDVKLNAVIKVGGLKLLPLNEHHIKGSVLNRIKSENPDAIGTVTKRG